MLATAPVSSFSLKVKTWSLWVEVSTLLNLKPSMARPFSTVLP